MQNAAEWMRRYQVISKQWYNLGLNCNIHRCNFRNRTFLNFQLANKKRRLYVNVASYEHIPAPKNNYQIPHRKLYSVNCTAILHCHLKTTVGTSPTLYSPRLFSTTVSVCSSKSNKDDNNKDDGKKDDSNKDDKDRDEEKKKIMKMLRHYVKYIIAFPILLFLFFTYPIHRNDMKVNTISWYYFYTHMLSKGDVEKLDVYIRDEDVVASVYLYSTAKQFSYNRPSAYIVLPDITELEERLLEAEDKLQIPETERLPVNIVGQYNRTDMIITFLAWIIILSAFPTLFFSGKSTSVIQRIKQMHKGKANITIVMPDAGKGVGFADVAGLKEAKTEVMEFVDILKTPDKYRHLGAKAPKGALLLGPPGCGKTMLAKAVATEASVPFLSMNGTDFVEMYGGLGASRLRNLFDEAKKRAPSIVYIDEIDSFGVKRQGNYDGTSEIERTLVQFLVELDGMTSCDDVIVLASTNRPDALDKALLRPGRFDRLISIDLPTRIERKEIFDQYLKNIVLEHPPPRYAEYLASLTNGFSGAGIATACNEAALHAARFGKKHVDESDLRYAIDRAVWGPEKQTNSISPAETRVIAYEEAAYVLLAWFLKHMDPVEKVTIVPTTSGILGRTQLIKPQEEFLMSEQKLLDKVCAELGTRVCEEIVFGQTSSATSQHLETATKLVYKHVVEYGLNKSVGLLSFSTEPTLPRGKPYSKKMGNLMDKEVRRIIAESSDRARSILNDHIHLLHLLAEELMKKETLYYRDLERLLGPNPYGKKPPVPFEYKPEDNNIQSEDVKTKAAPV